MYNLLNELLSDKKGGGNANSGKRNNHKMKPFFVYD